MARPRKHRCRHRTGGPEKRPRLFITSGLRNIWAESCAHDLSLVIVCAFCSALSAQAASSMFLQTLIDDYIAFRWYGSTPRYLPD